MIEEVKREEDEKGVREERMMKGGERRGEERNKYEKRGSR